MTKNVPDSLPIKTDSKTESEIREWISKRPAHDIDSAINCKCRWGYTIIDDGFFSLIEVKDRFNGETFSPEVNTEDF